MSPNATPRQLAKLAECVASLKRIVEMAECYDITLGDIKREALACLQKVEKR